MKARTASRLARSLLALTIATLLLSSWLDLRSARRWDPEAFAPALLAFAVVGALVASRRSDNPIGWLFLAMGSGNAMGDLFREYATYEPQQGAHLPGAAWAAWMFTMSIEIALPFLLLSLLLFPNGRLLSRRWVVVAWAAVLVGVVGTGATGVADVNFSANFADLRDPVRIFDPDLIEPIYRAYQFASLVLVLAAAVAVGSRLRRSGGEERQQLKWFAYAGALAAVAFVVLATLPLGAEPVLAFVLFVPLVPIAAGVAILKYRLYDIDVVISKTVVFGGLAAFITAVYVGIVVGIGSLVGRGGEPNVGLQIAATAVVAVAFQPVRERVQRFANRLVYGQRATPYEILTRFSERVAGTYATEDVLPRTARVLAEGTGAARADVWIRVGDELRLGASWPADGVDGAPVRPMPGGELPPFEGVSRATAVLHRGELLGAVTVTKPPGEPLTPAEDKLLTDLASQAGLVLRNVGLTEELRARLGEISRRAGELRASRQRIVAAHDAERRRLERNIHDGAQQHLVALAVKLRLARELLARDSDRAETLIRELRGETTQALETLRDLARGIYPPILEEHGIAAALEVQARMSGAAVEIEADGLTRHPIEAEAAVYFCSLEALQNAVKHAGASVVRIELAEAAGRLLFSVSDDGRGFDASRRGSGAGLQNMADRVAALGGRLEVRSEPGRGTTVSGDVPIRIPELVR